MFTNIGRLWDLIVLNLQHIFNLAVLSFLITFVSDFPTSWIAALLIAAVVAGLTFPNSFKTVSRCIFPLMLGAGASGLYYKLYQFETLPLYFADFPLRAALALAKFNEDYAEPFYTAISTLYAIIVALALVKGLESIDEVRRGIIGEVSHLRSIWHYLTYFEISEKERDKTTGHLTGKIIPGVYDSTIAARLRLRSNFIGYCHNAAQSLTEAGRFDNEELLNDCRRQIREMECYDNDDAIAYQEIMRGFDQLTILRNQRRRSDQRQLPRYLTMALWIMSAVLILPFAAEPACVTPKPEAAATSEPAFARATTIQDFTRQRAATAQADREQDQIADIMEQLRGSCPEGTQLSPQFFSMVFMIFVMTGFFSFLMLLLGDIAKIDNGFWRVDTVPLKELGEEFEEKQRDLIAKEIASLRAIEREDLVSELYEEHIANAQAN